METLTGLLRLIGKEPTGEKEKRVGKIRKVMEKGGSVLDMLGEIQQLPNPIVLDANNVLVNSAPPYEANPEASEFLRELREIGTVIVVTVSPIPPKELRKLLQQVGLYSPDMLILTRNNWLPAIEDRESEKALRMRGNFAANLQERGIETGVLAESPPFKMIGPIFGGKHDVPIIDDCPLIRHNGPNSGMIPIVVKPYTCPTDFDIDYFAKLNNKGTLSLPDALQMVKEYYGHTVAG